MGCFFFFVLVVGAIAAALAYNASRRTAARGAWSTAARSLGLVCSEGGTFDNPSIRGSLTGYRIAVDVVTRGGGKHKHKQTFTRYRVHYPPLGLGMRLTKEVPVFTTVAKAFGSQDIEVGDKSFDDDVVVQGEHELRIRAFLAGPRRAIIHRFLNGHRSAVVADAEASFETRGLETNAITLQRNLSAIARLARDVQAAPEPSRSPELPRPIVEPHPLEGAAAAARATAAAPVYDVETRDDKRQRRERDKRARRLRKLRRERVAKITTNSDSGAGTATATATGTELGAEAGSDAVDVDTRETPNEPSAAPVESATEPLNADRREPTDPHTPLAPGTAPHPAPSAAPVVSTDLVPDTTIQDTICNALFGKDLRIPDMQTLFASTYDGQHMRWSGRLKTLRHYYSDPVFGSEPGTRAEIIIAKVSAGMFGEREITAVLQLPEEAEHALRVRIGQDIAFSGRLTGLDAFMREVFVADGALLP